jgi:hypothetical protein
MRIDNSNLPAWRDPNGLSFSAAHVAENEPHRYFVSEMAKLLGSMQNDYSKFRRLVTSGFDSDMEIPPQSLEPLFLALLSQPG